MLVTGNFCPELGTQAARNNHVCDIHHRFLMLSQSYKYKERCRFFFSLLMMTGKQATFVCNSGNRRDRKGVFVEFILFAIIALIAIFKRKQ